MSRLLLILALAGAAGAASAQEAIPTAAGAPTGGAPDARATPPPGPLRSYDPAIDDESGPVFGPCGPLRTDANGKTEKPRARGEVEVGVGSHGYRHAGGVVCQPLGDKGAVTIAVDHTEWNGGRSHLASDPYSGPEQLGASHLQR